MWFRRTDASPGRDVLPLQKALKVAHLEVGNGLPSERAGGQHPARHAHGAATAAQAAAAVVAFTLAACTLALEHAELHRAALARHLTAPASLHYPLAYSAPRTPLVQLRHIYITVT